LPAPPPDPPDALPEPRLPVDGREPARLDAEVAVFEPGETGFGGVDVETGPDVETGGTLDAAAELLSPGFDEALDDDAAPGFALSLTLVASGFVASGFAEAVVDDPAFRSFTSVAFRSIIGVGFFGPGCPLPDFAGPLPGPPLLLDMVVITSRNVCLLYHAQRQGRRTKALFSFNLRSHQEYRD